MGWAGDIGSKELVVRRNDGWILVALGFVLAALSFARWSSYPLERSGAALVLFVAGWGHLACGIALLRRPAQRTVALAAVASTALVVGWFGLHVVSPDARTSIVATVWVALEAVNALIGASALRRVPQERRPEREGSLTAAVLVATVLVIGVAALVHQGGSAIALDAQVAGDPPPSTASPAVTDTTPPPMESVLDPSVRAAMGAELQIAREAALRYPTVRDAKAAGMIGGTGSVPGTGAHFQFPGAGSTLSVRADGSFDPSEPGSWMYDGTSDDAPVVGVMYNALTPETPSGFAGDRDVWHQHESVCTKIEDGALVLPLDGDTDSTKADCDLVGGVFSERSSWMLHAWVVSGWDSPEGVFSHSNPAIGCPDGTDDVDPSGICVNS